MKQLLVVSALAALFVAPSAAEAKRYNLTMTFGQDVLLVGKDDINLRARCLQNDGGSDKVQVYAVTASNAVLRGTLGSYLGNGNYLTAVTPIELSRLLSKSTATGTPQMVNDIDGGSVLNLATKRGFTLSAESSILGLNVNGNDCTLSVEIDKITKFKVPK